MASLINKVTQLLFQGAILLFRNPQPHWFITFVRRCVGEILTNLPYKSSINLVSAGLPSIFYDTALIRQKLGTKIVWKYFLVFYIIAGLQNCLLFFLINIFYFVEIVDH